MIDLKSITIPLPFEGRISPFATAVEDRNREWARTIGLTTADAAAQRFDRAQFGYGASCVFPSADMTDLVVCANWLSWLLSADDQHGEGSHGTPGAWEAARSRLEAVLRGAEPSSPIEHGLADLCQRTLPHMPAGWRERFTSHIQEVFDGYQMESVQRLAGISAEPDDFVRIRRYTGSVPFCIDLAEFAARTEVPETIYQPSEFSDLLLAVNDVISWVNDVYSVNKELARADHSNYLISLMQHRDLSLEQALRVVIDRITGRAAEFCAAENKLCASVSSLGLSAELRRAAWKNVTAMRDWMAGQIYWYKATDRYSTFEDIQVTGTMPPAYVPDLFVPIRRR
jgi:Terpene synthase family 2, C-terminal metal binding